MSSLVCTRHTHPLHGCFFFCFSIVLTVLLRKGYPVIAHFLQNFLDGPFQLVEDTRLISAHGGQGGRELGGRGLAIRAGRATFETGLKGVGALVGVGDLAFRVLPLNTKLKIGLPALARIFSQFSDQISNVQDEGDHFVYTLERCPMCCGREADRPVCYLGLGLLQEALTWVSGGNTFKVDMQTCQAKGDDMGRYIIIKKPIT